MIKITEKNNNDNLNFSEAQLKWQSVLSNSKYAQCDVLGAIQGAYMNNPYIQNDRLKRVTGYPTLYTREELEEALKTPRENEKLLRNAAWFFYYTIPTMMKMFTSYTDIPLNKWYMLPEMNATKALDKPHFKKEYSLVHDFVKAINPERTFKNIISKILKEGKVLIESRYEISNGKVKYATLHDLPTDYWKITSRTSRGWSVSFDMTYFMRAGCSPSQFHPLFKKYYDEMLGFGCVQNGNLTITDWDNIPKDVEIQSHLFGGTYAWWKELPPNEPFHVISFDDADASSLSPWISTFLDMNDVNAYKYLQQELIQLPLSSIMTAEVPLHDNNKTGSSTNDTKVSPDMISIFMDIFNNMSGSQFTKSFFAPFEKFQMHKMDAPTKENIVGDALSNLFAQTGTNTLFTVEKKPSVMQSKIFQKIETAFMTKIYNQLMPMMEDIINSSGAFKYKYVFKLFGDVFSKDERIATLEKGLASGHKNLIFEYLAYFDQTILEAESANNVLEMMDYYSHLQPTTSAFQMSKSDTTTTASSSKKNGRPKASIEKIESDSTESGISLGSNTADGRESDGGD